MGMMHTSVLRHYESIFALKQYHGWSITEIEDMLPWEFEIYQSLLTNYLKTVEAQRKQDAISRSTFG